MGWSENQRATANYSTFAIPDHRPIWPKNPLKSDITRGVHPSICCIFADRRIYMNNGRFLRSRLLPLAPYLKFSGLAQISITARLSLIKNWSVSTRSNYHCSGNRGINLCSQVGPTSHKKILVPWKQSVISPTKLHIHPPVCHKYPSNPFCPIRSGRKLLRPFFS